MTLCAFERGRKFGSRENLKVRVFRVCVAAIGSCPIGGRGRFSCRSWGMSGKGRVLLARLSVSLSHWLSRTILRVRLPMNYLLDDRGRLVVPAACGRKKFKDIADVFGVDKLLIGRPIIGDAGRCRVGAQIVMPIGWRRRAARHARRIVVGRITRIENRCWSGWAPTRLRRAQPQRCQHQSA